MKRLITPVDAIPVPDRRAVGPTEHPRGILAIEWLGLPCPRFPTCKEDPRHAPG